MLELDLKKVVTQIKKATNDNFPVFKNTVEKDELKEINSYIIYKPYGKMRRTEKGEFQQDFYLAFITNESNDFFEYTMNLIAELRKAKLIFDESDWDEGELKSTGENAEIYSFTFHRQLKCNVGLWSSV